LGGKPLQNEFATSNNIYRDVHAYSSNTPSITGALVIELPSFSGFTNQMLTFIIKGFTYTSGSAWELFGGGYAYNSGSWNSFYAETKGNPPFSTINLGWNPATGRHIIVLGTISTSWVYPKIYVTEFTAGFSTSNALSTGWSSSIVTDVSSYTGMQLITVRKAANLSDNNVWTGTNNFTNVQGIIGGFGATATTGTLDWNNASNARSGNGYSLLLGTATNGMGGGTYYHPFSFEYNSKNGTGGLTQMAIPYTAGDLYYRTRTAGTWASWRQILSKTTADATYVPLSAVSGTTGTYSKFTATNTIGNAFLKDDANGTYFESSAIERLRMHTDGRVNIGGIVNRYSKVNVLGGINADSLKSNNYTSLSGPTFFNYAPDFTPYQDGTDRIYVMKGDGELRSKELRDLLNDISANDTFALTGTTGGVFSLSSAATTTVDLGVYTNSISTNSVIEFRLVSGNPFYDNQQITVMSSKNMTCGQGVKIRLADNGGTSLVQLCNDPLGLLTEEYEFSENPLPKFALTFQYSKKRNKWRITSFKPWNDL
jgi:hypothetical protein